MFHLTKQPGTNLCRDFAILNFDWKISNSYTRTGKSPGIAAEDISVYRVLIFLRRSSRCQGHSEKNKLLLREFTTDVCVCLSVSVREREKESARIFPLNVGWTHISMRRWCNQHSHKSKEERHGTLCVITLHSPALSLPCFCFLSGKQCCKQKNISLRHKQRKGLLNCQT